MDKNISKYLPQIDKLLKETEKFSLPKGTTKTLLKKALSNLSEKQRKALLDGSFTEEKDLFSKENFKKALFEELNCLASPTVKTVVNATGTLIHTNLGRAPLSPFIIDEIKPFLTEYSDLEFDLLTGKRGSREKHLFQDFFENYKILVVNNNAAACLLVLSTLAKGKEVIVSRGELVEIGGSFRIPDIMKQSGAILREVGTTNKTRLADYESSISDNTGLILKVHRSNFVMDGFVEDVSSEQLLSLSKRYGIPFFLDAGSGALKILSHLSTSEPVIENEISLGVDIISFSGDKLLGGTQAGIIVAKPSLLKQFKDNPLYRALRPDKFTIYYLSRLFYYLSIGDTTKSPVIKNLLTLESEIKKRAEKLFRLLKGVPKDAVKIDKDVSAPGGGALPGVFLPTFVVKIKHPSKKEEEVRKFFLNLPKPIITRQKEAYTLIDLRTVFEEDLAYIAKAIIALFT